MLINKMKTVYKNFTLIEIAVTMAIFSVIILGIMGFLRTIHKTSNISRGEKNMFENSRMALDVISRDLQCIYYGPDSAPFWHWNGNSPSSWGEFRNELLAFVSTTPLPPNNVCTSDLCEVKYQLYYTTDPNNDLAGWLTRSVTGNREDEDEDNLRWNFNNNYDDDPSPNFLVGFTSSTDGDGIPYASFTANSASNDDYQRLIPYVTKFEITCYDREGNIISPDTQTSTDAVSTSTQPETTPAGMEFPYSVQISISLMDRYAWRKWISIEGVDLSLEDESTKAANFRRQHERTFTETVLIGERGQNL